MTRRLYRVRCNRRCCRTDPNGHVAFYRRNGIRTYSKREAARFMSHASASRWLGASRRLRTLSGHRASYKIERAI